MNLQEIFDAQLSAQNDITNTLTEIVGNNMYSDQHKHKLSDEAMQKFRTAAAQREREALDILTKYKKDVEHPGSLTSSGVQALMQAATLFGRDLPKNVLDAAINADVPQGELRIMKSVLDKVGVFDARLDKLIVAPERVDECIREVQETFQTGTLKKLSNIPEMHSRIEHIALPEETTLAGKSFGMI